VVCSEEKPPEELTQTAAKLNSPVLRRGVDFDLLDDPDAEGKMLQFSMAGQSIAVPYPSMGGAHQLDNLAVSLAAIVQQNPSYSAKVDQMAAAIRACRLPGRLQVVAHTPDIILDVGHNELAAKVVAAYLGNSNHPAVTCVLAMLADKDVEGIARVLDKCCKRWICADSPGNRGQTSGQLASRVQTALPEAEVNAVGTMDDAMEKAITTVAEDETILVFGSFTSVSTAANWLNNSMQRDGHDTARIT